MPPGFWSFLREWQFLAAFLLLIDSMKTSNGYWVHSSCCMAPTEYSPIAPPFGDIKMPPKKTMRNIPLTLSAFVVLVLATSCSNDAPKEEHETVLSGTATILVDSAIYDMMRASKSLYDALTPKAHVTFKPVDARTAMSELFAANARGIIIARDYVTDEQTALKSRGAEFPRTQIATDALVLFTQKSFPTDTLNDVQVKDFLKGGKVNLAPLHLATTPVFVVPGVNSSEYANIVNVILRGQQPLARMTLTASHASTREAVLAQPGRIGVGLLSQLVRDTAFKMLRIGFTDTAGARVYPQHVHQGYVVQGMYPYPVPIYIMLKDAVSQYSIPTGVMQFLARDGKAQRTFLDAGIVPAHAKIELNITE